MTHASGADAQFCTPSGKTPFRNSFKTRTASRGGPLALSRPTKSEGDRSMRKFFTAVLLGAFATAALAQDGVRRHMPRYAGSDFGLTAPSTASPANVLRNYLRASERTLAVAQ